MATNKYNIHPWECENYDDEVCSKTKCNPKCFVPCTNKDVSEDKTDCRDKKCTECDGECFLEDDKKEANARPARYEGYDCWKSEEDECSKDCPTCEHGVKQQEDMVQQPDHYRHGKYEVIDEMLIVFGPKKTFDFCILNSWKYRARAPFKGKMEEDMEKSSRYLEMAKQIADTYEEIGYEAIRLIKEN